MDVYNNYLDYQVYLDVERQERRHIPRMDPREGLTPAQILLNLYLIKHTAKNGHDIVITCLFWSKSFKFQQQLTRIIACLTNLTKNLE